MKREVEATDDDMVAIQTVDGELYLLSPEQAEQVANRYTDPFRSYIIEAVSDTRNDDTVADVGF
jgi:hypothetical protein